MRDSVDENEKTADGAPPFDTMSATSPDRPPEDILGPLVLVMGVSFGPMAGASLGVLLIHFKVISIYTKAGKLVALDNIRDAMPTLAWFGALGFLLPVVWYVWHQFRLRDRRRQGQSL